MASMSLNLAHPVTTTVTKAETAPLENDATNRHWRKIRQSQIQALYQMRHKQTT